MEILRALVIGVMWVVVGCSGGAQSAASSQVIEGFTFESVNTQGLPEYTHDRSGIRFVLLPGGEFEMGSPDTEAGHRPDEGPVHTVKLSPFLIAKYEVTQAEYEKVMTGHASLSARPSINYGDALLDSQRPVEQVSWNDLQHPFDGFLARRGGLLPLTRSERVFLQTKQTRIEQEGPCKS